MWNNIIKGLDIFKCHNRIDKKPASIIVKPILSDFAKEMNVKRFTDFT